MCRASVCASSKHCRTCNKCVKDFDHHCIWLNNCIGSANWNAFFVTISSVVVMIGLHLGTCAYLLLECFVDEDLCEQRIQAITFIADFPKDFFLGILFAMCFVNVPIFLLDLQLVILHIFLWSQKMTTYAYIMNKRSLMEKKQTGKAEFHIKTLPNFMDWIVFCRCDKRIAAMMKKQGKRIERIDKLDDDRGTSSDAELGNVEAANKSPQVQSVQGYPSPQGQSIQGSPSPPGSTLELADTHTEQVEAHPHLHRRRTSPSQAAAGLGS